ncbi:MAG TPA: protein-disulfide reductase DsbD domain-containing protein [archaeon]|nr:protein-disulfide reductase DsbD domain-containing protein [archaeon]
MNLILIWVVAFLTQVEVLTAADTGSLVKIRLIADRTVIEPGKKFRLGLLFRIAEGSHIYWLNPGDAGLAPEVDWRLPEGFRPGPLLWPVPERIKEPGDLYVNVYENEVLLFTWVKPPEKLDAASVTLGAEARWLVCRKVCTMGSARAELELPVGEGSERQSMEEEIFKRYAPRVPRPAEDYPALKLSARWADKPGLSAETRDALIVLETTDKGSFFLTAENLVQWFDYPSGQAVSEKLYLGSSLSRPNSLQLRLEVRKLEEAAPWPVDWGGVLTVKIVTAGGDTVDCPLSLKLNGQTGK